MKKNFINLFFISFFIFLIFPFNAKAYNGYVIEKYDVDIKVNENNVLNVTETIDVNFSTAKHGIVRNIPLKNRYIRKGITTETRAKIDNLKINEQYSRSKENGDLILKIGDPDETIVGLKQYVISYDYDIGDDNVDQYDELYFNVIGDEWDTQINKVTFKIEMPKEFDDTLVNFTIGTHGATYFEDVKYNIDGNTIEGYVTSNSFGYALDSREGLTARIELPEGYFTGERKVFDPTSVIVYGLLIGFVLLILLSIKLFRKYSYWKKDLLVVEYTVPDNLTPAEIGYLYDGVASNKHIVSLITYFANKGYLNIIDEGKNKFSFKKLKDIPDSEPDYAKTTFNGLFKKADSEGVVKKSDLKEKFYTTLATAVTRLKSHHKIYNNSHTYVGLFYGFMLFLPIYAVIFLKSISTYRLEYDYSVQYGIVCILGVILTILNLVFLILNKKRTEDATKKYNRARGFKHYMEEVEKDKLEALVMENPNYFYDILPYAYVLGVSDKWSSKFESIVMEPPTWYTGNVYSPTTGTFNINKFNNSLNHTISNVSGTMSSRPYESSGTSGGGSFSGGGGSVGGGGGGGGGSSW